MLAPRLLRHVRPTSATLLAPATPRIASCAGRLTSSVQRARRCLLHTTPSRRNISPEELQRRLRSARPLVSHNAASRFENAGRGRHSKLFVVACAAAAAVFYFANSQTVPISGRRRFNFLSDNFLEVLGSANAEAVVQEIEEQGGRFLSERDPRVRTVIRVMERLIPVSGMADMEWKVRVIDDERESSLPKSHRGVWRNYG